MRWRINSGHRYERLLLPALGDVGVHAEYREEWDRKRKVDFVIREADARRVVEVQFTLRSGNMVKIDLYPKKWTRKCPLFDSVKLLSYEQKNIHEGADR